MDKERIKKWYQKKRYIIPAGFLSILLMGSSGDSTQNVNSAPANLNNVQQVQTQTQTVPSLKPINSVTPVYKPAQSDDLSNNNYYINTAGNTVHAPAYSENNSIPSGASAQCRDGTYSFSQSRRGTCSRHGGVASWL
jgi:hypothetical protein